MHSRTLTITPTEAVTVRRSSPEALEVEVVYGRSASPPPKHLHPGQDERFEVLAGELHARVDGSAHVLRTGDTLTIPRGAIHQLWNEGDAPARAVWETSPAGRTLDWFEAIDALHRRGRVGSDGMPGPLAFGVLLTEFRDVFRLAARPRIVVGLGLRLLAVAGRARGYETGVVPGPGGVRVT